MAGQVLENKRCWVKYCRKLYSTEPKGIILIVENSVAGR